MAGYKDIIGNQHIKDYFSHAVSSGKISHCYILSGEDGIGKNLFAGSFAQTLQCSAPKEERPCQKCHSCVQFLSKSHPDIIYTGHEKPTVIGVEDVRQNVVNDIFIKPYCSPYKIYIIDEAEKLSVQAQNALLKTIEEPPAYGIIMMLTTNSSAMLDTILSRSIVLNVKPVSDNELEEYLISRGTDEQKALSISRFAQGNIGKAVKMAESESFNDMVKLIMYMLKNAGRMSFAELLECIDKLGDYKLDVKDCFGFMRIWYRDILIFKATLDPNIMMFKEEYNTISKIARNCGYNDINDIIEAIDTASARLDANVNYQLTMELLWLAIRDSLNK